MNRPERRSTWGLVSPWGELLVDETYLPLWVLGTHSEIVAIVSPWLLELRLLYDADTSTTLRKHDFRLPADAGRLYMHVLSVFGAPP